MNQRDPNPYRDIPATVHTLTLNVTRLQLLTGIALDQLHRQAGQHDSYPTTASGRPKDQGGTAELTVVEAAAHHRLGDLDGERPGPVTQTWHLYDYVLTARDALNLAIQLCERQQQHVALTPGEKAALRCIGDGTPQGATCTDYATSDGRCDRHHLAHTQAVRRARWANERRHRRHSTATPGDTRGDTPLP